MTVNNVLYADATHVQFVMAQGQQFRMAGYSLDVYTRSLLYVLGVCDETRRHFADLFDFKEHGIKLNGLEKDWQTGTSRKVTRLAFNLWNGCMYDSEENAERGERSPAYAVDEIFCCGFQPYFTQAIKIRFPEYAQSGNVRAL